MIELTKFGQIEQPPSLPIEVNNFSTEVSDLPERWVIKFDGSDGMKDPSLLFGIQSKMGSWATDREHNIWVWFPLVHYDSRTDCFYCETPKEWGWASPFLLISTPLKDAAAMQLLIDGDRPTTEDTHD